MPDPIPPYPSIEYYLWRLKNWAAGAKTKSVLDMMSPTARNKLTESAKKVLANIPAGVGETTPGSAANYTRTGLPTSIDPGRVLVNPAFPQSQLDLALLHEGLHGYNYNKDTAPFPTVTPETRAELYRRMMWGHNPYYSMENHIDPNEMYAYAGMYGYENIPDELKDRLSKALNPNTLPAENNPAAKAAKSTPQKRNPSYIIAMR